VSNKLSTELSYVYSAMHKRGPCAPARRGRQFAKHSASARQYCAASHTHQQASSTAARSCQFTGGKEFFCSAQHWQLRQQQRQQQQQQDPGSASFIFIYLFVYICPAGELVLMCG
jgi:hypothetical protein